MACTSASSPRCRRSWRSARARRCSWPGPASPPASGRRRWSLLVDGEEQPLGAFGMPRLETMHANGARRLRQRVLGHRADRPALRPGRARAAGPPGERRARRPRRWPRSPSARPSSASRAQASVAICMTTCDPPLELFRRQVDSIRAQTHTDWVCVVSDDCSAPERFAAIQEVLADDPRFVLSRTPRRLGFYRNFERALGAGARRGGLRRARRPGRPLAPGQARDAAGRARRRAPRLQRRARGRARRPRARRQLLGPPHEQPLEPAVAAGGQLGHRRRLAVPRRPARTTRCRSRRPSSPTSTTTGSRSWRSRSATSRFVERPLYDYVQHGDATLGHAAANRMPGMRERVGALRRDPRERIRLWRMHYYVDACRLLQFAAVLRLRCWERMPAAKRRELERFERADRSLAPIAGLAWRGAQELLGRRRDTLGAEWMLFHAFAWRRAARRQRPRPADALRAARLAPAAGLRPAARGARARGAVGARHRGEDRAAAARGLATTRRGGSTC